MTGMDRNAARTTLAVRAGDQGMAVVRPEERKAMPVRS